MKDPVTNWVILLVIGKLKMMHMIGTPGQFMTACRRMLFIVYGMDWNGIVMVWTGMELFMVWTGMELFMVWNGMELFMVWNGMELFMVWTGMELFMVWNGMELFMVQPIIHMNDIIE